MTKTMWLLWMTCRFCRTSSRKLTWTGFLIGLYSIATDALVTLKWLNLITTVDFIMVVYTFTSVLMTSWITLWSCQQTGTFIITRGDSHIKMTEMLVVPLWGVLNCRFWSHLGQSLYLPIQVSLIALCITKFTKNALTITKQKSPFGICLSLSQHPQWSPLVV